MEYTTNHIFLEKLKQKDILACKQLYMQYADAMYSICIRMLQNETEAEDALQEAFIQIFKNIENFRNESSIGSWIKQIVINNCLNVLRKKKLIIYELDETVEIYENESELSSDYEFTTENIKYAIEQLPTGYKVIFNLFMFENYTHKQIATNLEISESTAKSQLFKAKRKLREILLQQKNKNEKDRRIY